MAEDLVGDGWDEEAEHTGQAPPVPQTIRSLAVSLVVAQVEYRIV